MTKDGLLVSKIEAFIRQEFSGEGTGHDWFHIDRVRKNALAIAAVEGGDLKLVEAGALLHDVADHKFHDHDLSVGPQRAREIVLRCGGSVRLADSVAVIVSEVSFKGAAMETPTSSIESAVVQDADRLDALGAIGIARTFAYGGSRHREIYDPAKDPSQHDDFLDYARSEGTTINHFYEKLLLLKDRMQTKTGRKMAEERHGFMLEFLDRFHREWKGG